MAIGNFEFYIGMSIAGIFTGLGSAIGTYLAQKHFIHQIEKVKKKLKKRRNDA
mgnify:CR=1 FL=1